MKRKEPCFALNKYGKCNILHEKFRNITKEDCEKCRFYKTIEQFTREDGKLGRK